MRRNHQILAALVALAVLLTAGAAGAVSGGIKVDASQYPVTEDGVYTSMEEVAVYLTCFDRLPDYFITKKQAQALGWDNRAGNLSDVAPGKSIGGDYFGNYEGNVPDAAGRNWTECDIDSDGGYRNGLRIVFSNDGLIYFSDDHYQSFRRVNVTENVNVQTPAVTAASPTDSGSTTAKGITEDGLYVAKDDVAAFLHQFNRLPDNYLTREDAQSLGWSNKKDNLGTVAPGYAIGGDRFGNREKLLPDGKGREWYECDVNVENGKRSVERLVWSNDGLIYYTPDSHKSFERLY